MADTGWLTADNVRNHPINSNPDWSDVHLAKISDDNQATCSMDGNTSGDGLNIYNFGASISSDWVIVGIEVKIERRCNGTGHMKDELVYLMDDTSTKGNNKADTSIFWPTSDTWKTYGGSSDKWGATWTPAQINASTFGVMLAPKNYYIANRVAHCDCIQIKIYYSIPSSIDHLMMMGM